MSVVWQYPWKGAANMTISRLHLKFIDNWGGREVQFGPQLRSNASKTEGGLLCLNVGPERLSELV